jgi:hypothetical protein
MQEIFKLCTCITESLFIVYCNLQQPVSLELGGKSPLIVFDDIRDIDKGLFLMLHYAPIFILSNVSKINLFSAQFIRFIALWKCKSQFYIYYHKFVSCTKL